MTLLAHETAVRRFDPERFLCALFAPAFARPHILSLLAFNLEISKTREVVTEPMIGQIRLQWWRDAIAEIYDATPRAHDVVQALARSVAETGIPRQCLDAMIDARELDLEESPVVGIEQLEQYSRDTSGGLSALWAGVCCGNHELDQPTIRTARLVGTAWSLVGLVRAIPFHAGQGRQMMPDALLGPREGAARRALAQRRDGQELSAVARTIADMARAKLADARANRQSIDPAGRSALLLAVLADGHLSSLARTGYRIFENRTKASPFRQQLRVVGANLLSRW